MDSLRGKTIQATFMHAPARGQVEIIEDGLMALNGLGEIVSVHKPPDPEYAVSLDAAKQSGTLNTFPQGHILLPGFVDLHIHAPQFPQLGKALDVPLEVWLQTYTFPLEARYADLSFAKSVYPHLVDLLLREGTTTAVYFGTIHNPATLLLAEACVERGQRAFVGRVVMDDPDQCPAYYCDANTTQALEDTRQFIQDVVDLKGNSSRRVRPILTPRFIPSCSDECLARLGEIATDTGIAVQTHCSESDWEHQFVINRCGTTDACALDRFGLLTRNTVLAHSNFITTPDMDLIRERGAGIAHCPLSNAYFSNAAFPLRRALEKGLRVGLGTDISGGPSASILDNCRGAVQTSRLLEDGINPTLSPADRATPESRIDFRDAFYLATAGGADVLGLNVGQFSPGYKFDAIVIDPSSLPTPVMDGDGADSYEDILQKIIMTAKSNNITTTIVEGEVVASG